MNKNENFEWQHIRHLVDTYEDMQHVRKAEMNRARMLIYRRLLDLGYMVEEIKDEEEKAKGEFSDKLLIEAFEKAKADNKLTKQELEMIDEDTKYGKKFKNLEAEIQKRFSPIIEVHPIYMNYLSKFKGVGILTSARLICYLGDCSKFDTISKLWAYSGYAVFDGKAQRRTKGKKSNWNSKLKTLMWGLVDGAIKHRTAYRVLIYDVERKRLRELYPEKIKVDGKTKYNDGHLHNMAIRKTAKIFLANYWLFVREMHKLPTRSPYAIDKLEHTTLMNPEMFFENRKVKKRKTKK